MIKVLLQTFLGLVFSVGGFYIAYIYLQGAETGTTPLLLLPVAVFIPLGIFCLISAGRSEETILVKTNVTETKNQTAKTGGGMLKRNNDLVAEWGKTIEERDRLKMLEASGSTEEHV